MTNKAFLLILDGWGLGPKPEADAIFQADTPFMDGLMKKYPMSTLITHGEDVGLPDGQMGNSEVGHLNIGAGRIVWQELARLTGTEHFMFGPTPATAAFIEASGSGRVITEILGRGRVGGRMSVVALHYESIPTSFLMVLMKEFTIRGSMEYPARFADAIDLLARRDLSELITHRFPLEQFDDALGVLQGSKDCGKVMVSVDPGLT